VSILLCSLGLLSWVSEAGFAFGLALMERHLFWYSLKQL